MKYAKMNKLFREDLVARYDEMAHNAVLGLEFIKQEIWHRDSERLNRNMERMTFRIQCNLASVGEVMFRPRASLPARAGKASAQGYEPRTATQSM